jgi:hypothetical protein
VTIEHTPDQQANTTAPGVERRRMPSAKALSFWAASAALLAALVCGVVGLVVSTLLWEIAVLVAISTGLTYAVIASRESNEASREIAKSSAAMAEAVATANRDHAAAFMAMAQAVGKLVPIPEPDDVFRHGSHTLTERRGKGGWRRVCLYAPVGIWMTSQAKDEWLSDLLTALERNDVSQCWGVYGLAPKSEAAAWHTNGDRRLKTLIDAPHTQLHYLPPEDARHPSAAPGLGIIVFESYGDAPEYKTIFLFISDHPESRGGFMIADRGIGSTVAKWFDAQVFHGCSANFILRPYENYKGKTPAQYMEEKLAEIGTEFSRPGGK